MITEAADEKFINMHEKDIFLRALYEADEKKCFACTINVVIASSIK